jgi:lysozyme
VDRCQHAFANDYAVACANAAKVIGSETWRGLNAPRQAVLADMAFNIGAPRLEGFAKMLAAIRRSDWTGAAAELLDSAYAHQVGGRAVKNAKALKTGEWP